MNLKKFRDQFPGFKPYALCRRKSDGAILECICWPYTLGDGSSYAILAREKDQPETSRSYRIRGETVELEPMLDELALTEETQP
jgi:hypothetical protein